METAGDLGRDLEAAAVVTVGAGGPRSFSSSEPAISKYMNNNTTGVSRLGEIKGTRSLNSKGQHHCLLPELRKVATEVERRRHISLTQQPTRLRLRRDRPEDGLLGAHPVCEDPARSVEVRPGTLKQRMAVCLGNPRGATLAIRLTHVQMA